MADGTDRAGLAMFMASVDMTIVNVALPAIERDLEIATSTTEWIVLAAFRPKAAAGMHRPRRPLVPDRKSSLRLPRPPR